MRCKVTINFRTFPYANRDFFHTNAHRISSSALLKSSRKKFSTFSLLECALKKSYFLTTFTIADSPLDSITRTK